MPPPICGSFSGERHRQAGRGMTPDFDKMARECTADFRDRGAAWDAVEKNIAAALREVWNAAMEEAAIAAFNMPQYPVSYAHDPYERDPAWREPSRIEVGAYLRSQKVPT